MIKRKIADKILQYAKQYPVVTITGPRQSGKTTLCKMLFPHKAYVSLEDIDTRLYARNDPRGFLGNLPEGAVIDEIQRVPELLSYIQTIVDTKKTEGMFILTGSRQFEVMANISQSLAGRTALARLLPFSLSEIRSVIKDNTLEDFLYSGCYPRIFDKNLNPTEAMSFYVSTYLERDVRSIINIIDFSKFETFLKLCAGRTGQILNLSSLGNDSGVNHNTIKSWLSVLEASYIIKLLRPYYKNFNKRLIKSPKIYFLDTGLVCYLLDITSPIQLLSHPLRGYIFETFVISELLKKLYNKGLTDNLYYFRDSKGNEIDILQDYGIEVDLIEIKSGKTISNSFFKGFHYFSKLSDHIRDSYLIYGGDDCRVQYGINIISWKNIS